MRKTCRMANRAAFFIATLLLGLGTSSRLEAAAIGFSDLGPGCSPSVPAGYQGLIWSSNIQIECNADYSSSYGNSYGSASGYAATNGGAPGSGLVEISINAGTFDFVGAEFSSFAGSDAFQAYSAESIVVYGFKLTDADDSPTYSMLLDLDPTQYTSQIVGGSNFTGINRLVIAAGSGPAGDPSTLFGVDGLSWLMTDVEINLSDVPEPGSMALLGAGMIAAFAVRRSKMNR